MKFVLGDRRCYGRRMRRLVPATTSAVLATLIACAGACSSACSGDDSHKQATLHPPAELAATPAPAPAPTPAMAAGDAAVGDAKPAALTEAMAAPYWKTADELAGAQQFALERWQPAMAAFEAALAQATDDERKAHLRLMIGLCAAQTGAWDQAMADLGFAHDHLPLLADYTGYQAAAAAYFAHKPAVAQALAVAVAPDSITGADAELLIGDILQIGRAHV